MSFDKKEKLISENKVKFGKNALTVLQKRYLKKDEIKEKIKCHLTKKKN
jgi:uncharacterized membrane-anchored protein YjiN (DUF445 family)